MYLLKSYPVTWIEMKNHVGNWNIVVDCKLIFIVWDVMNLSNVICTQFWVYNYIDIYDVSSYNGVLIYYQFKIIQSQDNILCMYLIVYAKLFAHNFNVWNLASLYLVDNISLIVYQNISVLYGCINTMETHLQKNGHPMNAVQWVKMKVKSYYKEQILCNEVNPSFFFLINFFLQFLLGEDLVLNIALLDCLLSL